jgi:hypothetical protein
MTDFLSNDFICENTAPTDDKCQRDGANDDRAIAPNKLNTMMEKNVDTATSTVEVDYKKTADAVNNIDVLVAIAPQETEKISDATAFQAAPESAPDPFDPESLRLTPENSGMAVKKVVMIVPCKKPSRQEFVRVRPGAEWQVDTLLLEDQDSGDCYIVKPELHDHLCQDISRTRLVLAMTRSNDMFLWRLKLPGVDGRSNHWNDSALSAAQLAETKWVRVISNMTAGRYDVFAASGIKLEPQWADDLKFKDILRLCFKDRFIDSLDHPFLKRLRGDL